MKSTELREKFLQYFKRNGHAIIPSSSLIPDNDPTVLFTTAGMHPLVPYLLGQKHPAGTRLVNFQKCLRTGDIDSVGDPVHHTFFEMLGNWSLNDYFKDKAIEMSFNFLTEELHIPITHLAISVFSGDNDAPRDNNSSQCWIKLGIPKQRITYLSKKDNWWGPAGKTGPCGPDTEMFYWIDKHKNPPEGFDPTNNKWVEIWNDVFMEYFKKEDGSYETLKQKNVDTGMGLERTLACLNGLDDNYLTDLFLPIIKKIEALSNTTYNTNAHTKEAMRIIADHIRAAVFILGDEKSIAPSNVDQGYILRRLIRRAIRYGKQIGIHSVFTFKIAEVVVKNYKNIYSELQKNNDFIVNQLIQEEEKFNETLEKGEKKLNKIFEKVELFEESQEGEKIVTREFGDYKRLGKDFFILFSEDGYPLELSLEILDEKKIGLGFGKLSINAKDNIKKEFDAEFKKHQKLSRTASIGKFKGGLADASKETICGHTATHLLLAALRKILGDHVYQKGSNITIERLRLDFSHTKKLTPQEIKKVEDLVNEQIQNKLPIYRDVMNLENAKKINAMGVFEHKYQEKVSVYTIGDRSNPFSREICGGPHVENTEELGHFKIIKEESVSAGIRRIKAAVK